MLQKTHMEKAFFMLRYTQKKNLIFISRVEKIYELIEASILKKLEYLIPHFA